jgi:hypothetical protein
MSSVPGIQRVVAILWPSFIVAGIATILFTTAFDPATIEFFVENDISRVGSYTICFFLFWLFGAITSSATCYFLEPCDTVNKSSSSQSAESVKD